LAGANVDAVETNRPLASSLIAKVSVATMVSVNSEFAEKARNNDECWMDLTIHHDPHRLANPESRGNAAAGANRRPIQKTVRESAAHPPKRAISSVG
jgi:hypothetical protein